MSTNNPVGLDGMEFIEYSGPDASLFEKLRLEHDIEQGLHVVARLLECCDHDVQGFFIPGGLDGPSRDLNLVGDEEVV
mgnify:CR=1 FL=1